MKIPGLDRGIKPYVDTLRAEGIETYESCQGGEGHAFHEPTVRFHGGKAEGFRALSVAIAHGLPVQSVQRIWNVIDGEPDGPYWQMTFYKKAGGSR